MHIAMGKYISTLSKPLVRMKRAERNILGGHSYLQAVVIQYVLVGVQSGGGRGGGEGDADGRHSGHVPGQTHPRIQHG